MRRPNSMFRGVLAWVVMRPNCVGLVRLRVGLLITLWFRTLVNWKISVAPTRSPMMPKSLATDASRFHLGRTGVVSVECSFHIGERGIRSHLKSSFSRCDPVLPERAKKAELLSPAFLPIVLRPDFEVLVDQSRPLGPLLPTSNQRNQNYPAACHWRCRIGIDGPRSAARSR